MSYTNGTAVGTTSCPIYVTSSGVATQCNTSYFSSITATNVSYFYYQHGFVVARLNGYAYSTLEICGNLDTTYAPKSTSRFPGFIIYDSKVYIAVLRILTDGTIDGTYWTSYPGSTQPNITSDCLLYFNIVYSYH